MGKDKYAEIVDAATTLFSQHGFEATSIRDIAEAVGLQPGSLYAHIDSKDGLLFDIVNTWSDEFLGLIPIMQDSEVEVIDRIRAIIHAHLSLIANSLPSATVYLHEWRRLEGERWTLALKKRQEYETRLVALLDEGVEVGALREVNTRLAAVALLSLLNWSYNWYRPGGRLSIDEITDTYADLVLEGLVNGARKRRRRR